MTNEETEKVVYENPDGEIFDVRGAFDRHPAITPSKGDIDIWAETNSSYDLEFTIRLGAGTMARLCQILNAAPVNGDPLNATVNLETDSTAELKTRYAISRYLTYNGYDSTLENIAAGYIYNVDTMYCLEVYAAGREYAISRVNSITGESCKADGETHTITKLTVSARGCTVPFTAKKLTLKDFHGKESGGWRIIHSFDPDGFAPYGGVILERITD